MEDRPQLLVKSEITARHLTPSKTLRSAFPALIRAKIPLDSDLVDDDDDDD